MSSAQLKHAIRVCEKLVEGLPQLANNIIQTAENSIQAAIPPFWPTYRAGIKRTISPDVDKIELLANQIEGAVNQHILDWAQKVFPVAGMAAPADAHSYTFDDGGAYPERIEESGSPDYPGNRAVGAGRSVWMLAGQAARDEAMRRFKEMTR